MEKDKPLKLTVKEELFAQNYIKTGNASEAYRRSYSYKNMKDTSIVVNASKILNNTNVSLRVKQLQDKLSEKHDISKDRILKDLNCYLNADIRDYVDFDGEELKFKPFDKLTKEQSKCIDSVKMGRNGLELKLNAKLVTIDRICKMLGYDAPIKTENKIIDVCVDDGLDEE
jgi:phage terminase small subunit